MLATDFMIAPTQPPAKGPRNPTIGTLINKDKIDALNPKKIQHKTQGRATKSIRINHGVINSGGRICITTESAANTAAPAILIVVFSRLILKHLLLGKERMIVTSSNYLRVATQKRVKFCLETF